MNPIIYCFQEFSTDMVVDIPAGIKTDYLNIHFNKIFYDQPVTVTISLFTCISTNRKYLLFDKKLNAVYQFGNGIFSSDLQKIKHLLLFSLVFLFIFLKNQILFCTIENFTLHYFFYLFILTFCKIIIWTKHNQTWAGLLINTDNNVVTSGENNDLISF